MHRKDPLLLKSSTDLREIAPPVTMMALLSSGLSASVDVDSISVEDVENVAVEECDVVKLRSRSQSRSEVRSRSSPGHVPVRS